MHSQRNITTALAIIVSIAATYIGVSNLMWFLDAINVIDFTPSHIKKR
jgi:hypothetical protein